MLFHLYIIIISLILFIEAVCALMTTTWLKSYIDLQSKVLLVMSCVPSVLAIVMALAGSMTISVALAIITVVVTVYAFGHKMTNVDATISTKRAKEALKTEVKHE